MSRIALAPSGPGSARPACASAVRAALRPAAAIGELAADWTALAAAASEPNPYAEHWFVAASLATLGAGQDIRLLEVRRGARLIGVMPLAIETGYAHLPVRYVRHWQHDHHFLATPLIAAGEERAFWEAALAALDASDWAPNFLHLRYMAEDGPVHRAMPRGAIVHRRRRALLESGLTPDAYLARAVRAKKRKELRRQRSRLAELGALEARYLRDSAELRAWCDDYLALEAKGWKGREGSALSADPVTTRFFRDTLAAAQAAGRLQFLRLDLDGRAIAMLVNFLTPPGSFSFKTVFDEAYARFSPGVLVQIENLAILDDPAIAWMDSCAMDDHPMIDGFWTGRRNLVRVTVPLRGMRRRAVHGLCRALEMGSLAVRKALT